MRKLTLVLICLLITLKLYSQVVNTIYSLREFTYDKQLMQSSKVKKIEIKIFNEGIVSGMEEAFFDKKGLLSKISSYDGTGKLRSEDSFIWDKQQHVVKRLSVNYEYIKQPLKTFTGLTREIC